MAYLSCSQIIRHSRKRDYIFNFLYDTKLLDMYRVRVCFVSKLSATQHSSTQLVMPIQCPSPMMGITMMHKFTNLSKVEAMLNILNLVKL